MIINHLFLLKYWHNFCYSKIENKLYNITCGNLVSAEETNSNLMYLEKLISPFCEIEKIKNGGENPADIPNLKVMGLE